MAPHGGGALISRLIPRFYVYIGGNYEKLTVNLCTKRVGSPEFASILPRRPGEVTSGCILCVLHRSRLSQGRKKSPCVVSWMESVRTRMSGGRGGRPSGVWQSHTGPPRAPPAIRRRQTLPSRAHNLLHVCVLNPDGGGATTRDERAVARRGCPHDTGLAAVWQQTRARCGRSRRGGGRCAGTRTPPSTRVSKAAGGEKATPAGTRRVEPSEIPSHEDPSKRRRKMPKIFDPSQQ